MGIVMYYSYQWLKDVMKAVRLLPPAPTTEMINQSAVALDSPGIEETVRIGLDRLHEILGEQFPSVRDVNSAATAVAFLMKTPGAMQALEHAIYED